MDEEITIGPAKAADAGPLLVVQRSAYLSEAQRYGDPFIPPLVETLEQVIDAVAGGGVLVARSGARVVGSVRWRLADGVCHVGRLSVADDQQGRGIGGRLLEQAEAACPGVPYTLFTGADSPANIRLYERHGYVRGRVEQVNNRYGFQHLTKPATAAG